MSIRSFFTDLFGAGPSVTPATGLPMTSGTIDVTGNPYGTDLHRHDDPPSSPSSFVDHHHDHHHAGSSVDNDWSSSSWSGVSSSWSDHSSTSDSGYDPSRGW